MDSDRFDRVLSGAQNLMDEEVDDLSAITSDPLRDDGLPQDWVDDVPNLTSTQSQELKDKLADCAYQWAESLKGML